MRKLHNEYNFIDKIKLCVWFIKTKFISTKARLIRFPFVYRGRKYIDLGHSLTTGVGCRFEAFNQNGKLYKRIIIGDNVQINDYVHISSIEKVEIGHNVLMASHIYISDNSHGIYDGCLNDSDPNIPPKDREYLVKPVKIGDNVWLGDGVIVMPGVTIGKGCVIGAHSIVNKDIPEFSIAVGAPAKVIKIYSLQDKCWKRI